MKLYQVTRRIERTAFAGEVEILGTETYVSKEKAINAAAKIGSIVHEGFYVGEWTDDGIGAIFTHGADEKCRQSATIIEIETAD